jgi:hypothetical protein
MQARLKASFALVSKRNAALVTAVNAIKSREQVLLSREKDVTSRERDIEAIVRRILRDALTVCGFMYEFAAARQHRIIATARGFIEGKRFSSAE